MERSKFQPIIDSSPEIETSTAKLHDSQIDLSIEGEVVLRDRGYFDVGKVIISL